MSKKAIKTTTISPTTATSPAISPERPAANSDADGRTIPPEVGELPDPQERTDPVHPIDPIDEKPTIEEQVDDGPGSLREPGKFAALRTYIASTLSAPSVEAQIGKLTAAGLLTDKNLWETKDPWHVAATALAKVKDPVWLAGYWPSICFLRGKTLGNPRNEAQIAMSIAVIETVGEMIGV